MIHMNHRDAKRHAKPECVAEQMAIGRCATHHDGYADEGKDMP
jgi:hypothetical protein